MKQIQQRKSNYFSLVNDIELFFLNGKKKAVFAVNNILVETYWNIGKRLVEFEQKGNLRAGYGSNLLFKISADLITSIKESNFMPYFAAQLLSSMMS